MGAAWPVHSLLPQLDGLLLLAPAALAPWRLSSLWAVPCAYTVFALAGRRNVDFAYRCPSGDGILFAVCVGPVLVSAYTDEEALWSGTIVSTDLLTLGSLQALADFSFPMGPAAHAAQLAVLAVAGSALARLPLPPLALFLAVQKLVTCWCFERRRWGRCFSPAEGLFWAQATAVACTCLHAGCAAGFSGWSCTGAFGGALLFLGLTFLALTLAAHGALGARAAAGRCAPLGAAVACLALGLAWGAAGLGPWPRGCPGPPLAWLAGLLAEHARLLLLWAALLGGGVAAIDSAARRLPGAGGPGAARLRQLLLRKAFHALALGLFAPPLLGGCAELLGLALLAAALLFVALEACRACRAPGLGRRLDAFVRRYLDTREDAGSGDLVLTHLYLLLGCALPVWLEAGGTAAPPAPPALLRGSGLLLVGVGDACAAAVGAAAGRRCWPASHRTLEGSTAFAAGALLATVGFLRWEQAAGAGGPAPPAPAAALAGAVLLSALVEVYTQSIDNLVLPLFFCPSFRALASALR